MWVHLEGHEPHLLQVVDDSLHILAIAAHVAGEPRNGLGAFGEGDGSEDLPAGARQTEVRTMADGAHCPYINFAVKWISVAASAFDNGQFCLASLACF